MEKLTMNDCTKRKLDDTYLVVYAIKNEINVKKGEYIEKEDIYTLVGVNVNIKCHKNVIVKMSQF